MPTAGLKTIIALSFVLALGFLLVILSCALHDSYLPLLVVATYVVAPIPNWICGRCANPDDFVESAGAAIVDVGRFFTGFFVMMGMGTFSPSLPRPLPCFIKCEMNLLLTLLPQPFPSSSRTLASFVSRP